MQSAGKPLSARAGIATGPVVVGDRAGTTDEVGAIAGATPNLAARLQDGPIPVEVLEATARREFEEETGQPPPDEPFIALTDFSIGSGKRLQAFATLGEIDADAVTGDTSNTFELEWPPRSGRISEFPEVDAAQWVDLATAATKLHKGQARLVDLLMTLAGETGW